MITTFILTMVLGVVSGAQSLLPTWNVNTSAVSNFTGDLGSTMWKANGYVPEHLLWICLGIILAVKIALFAWRGIVFIYSMIPFAG